MRYGKYTLASLPGELSASQQVVDGSQGGKVWASTWVVSRKFCQASYPWKNQLMENQALEKTVHKKITDIKR